jgi:hypothetical protein
MGIVERCFIATSVMGLLLLIGIGFLPLYDGACWLIKIG